jgi:aconitate hydratase
MLPFTIGEKDTERLRMEDLLYVPGIRRAISSDAESIGAVIIRKGERTPLELKPEDLTREDREIILAGCLINYYAQ